MLLRRQFSSQVKRCVLKKNSANPFEAFEIQTADIASSSASKLQKGQVRARLVAAVVTPRDVQAMRNGKPGTVAGDSALLEVIETGASSSAFKQGDRVQAVNHHQGGLWQTEPVVSETAINKLGGSGVTASNFAEYLAVAQAVALLRGLKPYDEVAVTEAQSVLGSAVARVGKQQQLKVLCVVSPSYATEQSLQRLKLEGAEASVVAEFEKQVPYVGSAAFRRLLGDWKGLKLVVSADGGLLANELARMLQPEGQLVVVGGAPITLPASAFLDKRITVKGAPQPTADDYAQAAKLLVSSKVPAQQQIKQAAFSLAEAHKAVDAFGLGPVAVIKP